MYANVRRYESIQQDVVSKVMQHVSEGFVPIISKAPGFLGYYAFDAGDGTVASITIFESEADAAGSNQIAAGWVKENLADLLSSTPQITAGEVLVYKTS
ncbi:hypothetical protein KFU94_01185 [Chloroflexi bacterium TSY]|nr:hypothetical protein [Chloroflexi bacterium TSY]